MVIPVNVAALVRVVSTGPSVVLTAVAVDTEINRLSVLTAIAGVLVTSEFWEGPFSCTM